MAGSPRFDFQPVVLASRARPVLGRLPALTGRPIWIHQHPGLRDRHGPVHAGSFLRQRTIALDCTAREFGRVFVHELFHFVWPRLGNSRRNSFEAVLLGERKARFRGELGWSAEWRKEALTTQDVRSRSRRWREYCCESFCDTAAWLFSGIRRHPEFTLAGRARLRRRLWFAELTKDRYLSI